MNERTVSPLTRNYALGVLFVVYTFNVVDRQILAILLEPIKADLQLSDTALGMLTGFAFAMFYATLGLPIARYADRNNRRNLIALALAIWSGMTALCGAAQNFWQLLIARIGVGVGEAGCSPPAHSMIADYFSIENRATALGIYSLGVPIGILFGFITGGWLNEEFGWRVAFLVVGLPGLLLALVVRFTVREPDRGMAEGRLDIEDQPSVRETFAFLWRKKTFRHMATGCSIVAFVQAGIITWVPSFMIRSYDMTTSEVGLYLGLILGIPGGIGTFLGGYLADKFGSRDTRWYLWVVPAALLPALPFSMGVFLSESAEMSLAFLVIPILLGYFFQATTFSQTQGLVPLRMRAVAAAVLFFIGNLLGTGAGPQFVGLLSDLLANRFGIESLRYSLLICSTLSLWGAWHYYVAGKYLEDDLITR